jgi:hypothetical protein
MSRVRGIAKTQVNWLQVTDPDSVIGVGSDF